MSSEWRREGFPSAFRLPPFVNVIGASGDRPRADYLSGSMANAALIAMSRALGAEGPDHGVRVVGLNPAATETGRQAVRWKERAQKQLGDPGRWRELTKGFPFGRLATVDENLGRIP